MPCFAQRLMKRVRCWGFPLASERAGAGASRSHLNAQVLALYRVETLQACLFCCAVCRVACRFSGSRHGYPLRKGIFLLGQANAFARGAHTDATAPRATACKACRVKAGSTAASAARPRRSSAARRRGNRPVGRLDSRFWRRRRRYSPKSPCSWTMETLGSYRLVRMRFALRCSTVSKMMEKS